MQQIMVSSMDLRACQQEGKMTVHHLLCENKALMSQTTSEQIGSGEVKSVNRYAPGANSVRNVIDVSEGVSCLSP
jgi:hypothetical protein